jgi:outer membrane protein assembly factor BamD (BamD/ComL family)
MYCRNLQVFAMTGFMVIMVFAAIGICAEQETQRLDRAGKWQTIPDTADGVYMREIAEVKQLVDTGQVKAAEKAFDEFRLKYPELSTYEIEAFNTLIEAELFYTKKKWTKAVRKYDFFLDNWPESAFRSAALDRQHSIAEAFLAGEKRRFLKIIKLSAYEEADNIMHGIENREGDTPRSQRALVALAEGYQKRGKFLDAAEAWVEVKGLWPAGQIGENALYQMAVSQDRAYKGSRYDNTTLLTAKTYFSDYRREYTHLAVDRGVDAKMSAIEEKLADKEYATGFHYENSENIYAAKLYYEHIMAKWPDSAAAESAKTRLSVIKSGKTDEATKKKLQRKAFDVTTIFLDKWFGLAGAKKIFK